MKSSIEISSVAAIMLLPSGWWPLEGVLTGGINAGSTPLWRCLDYFEPSRVKPEGSK